ncbi:MAG: ribonuclease HII [Bacteroidota bacterium]|nr:ribonuclease HII [Bacteroidota bacterium]
MTKTLLPYLIPGRIEAGCDEAGRGCLAGPVFAAAVILPEGFLHPLLDDSKKLSEKKRVLLREVIEKEAIAWAVADVSPKKIDEINILNASIQAMHKAIQALSRKPEALLIDGHRFKPYPGIPHSCEIKGDGRFLSIAAASVLAKTHRDEYMERIHLKYPAYCWDKNKGYPTKLHRVGILKHGVTEYHRMSYRLLDTQIEITFT